MYSYTTKSRNSACLSCKHVKYVLFLLDFIVAPSCSGLNMDDISLLNVITRR